MSSSIRLVQLKAGESAYVQKVEGKGHIRERLADLGFTENSKVTYLFSSMWDDPRAYAVRGTVVALRKSDAAKIYCVQQGEEHE